jgi:hypothetical protein
MQVFELTLYRVAIQGNDYSEIIYEGINFDDAKMEYNSVNISNFQDDYGGVVELIKFDRLYEYIYDLEDLEDFPFLKHYADNSLFKEIDETEIETLFERRVDYINQQSDELLSRVQQHYFQIYGDYKYNNIPVTNGLPEDDDDFIEFGCIQLRLADHSENLQNIDRFGVCDYYISVVIADKNATKEQFFSSKFERRKNEVELYFDSDSNFDKIIDEIEEKIENARQVIMLNYEKENPNLGRGGRIVQAENEAQKFGKIGITDKYQIVAMTDIGLSGIKFTKEGVEQAIKTAYENLALNVEDYTISEVSNAIINVIVNEKNVRLRQGDSIENIERYDSLIGDANAHQQYVDEFKKTQLSGLKEWVSYLNQSEYPYAFRYLMLRAVLNDNYDFKQDALQKRNKKTIRNFTPFDAGTLAEVYSIKSDYLLKDYTLKQLENADKIVAAREIAKTSGGGKWIKFNGGSNTPEDERRANASDLSSLVQDTYWCTKTNAKGQLNDGDFYVYVTEKDGKKFPRIAIRMEGNKVGEVRGNASAAQDLEPEMNPIAEEFLLNNLDKQSGKKWLDSIRYNQRAYDFYLEVLENDIYEGFVEDFIDLKKDEKTYLLDYANRNGHIQRLEKYIEENFDEIEAIYGKGVVIMSVGGFNPKTTKVIFGDADFENSKVQSLGNLQTIGGDANFRGSKIQDLGNLLTIGGFAIFRGSKIQDLGNLLTIGGFANFENSQVQDLGNLHTIWGGAFFENSQVQDLGNLHTIGKSADFANSKVQDLGNLLTIGGTADFSNSQVQDLGNLQTIGGLADFRESEVQDLGNLQTIGGYADFKNSKVQSLGNLQTIGGSAYFKDSQVQSLGNLQTIGDDADFENSQVQDLGNLQTIGGYADFKNSKVQSLGNLQTIGGSSKFRESQVQSLGNLQTIGGRADFRGSQVQSLGNLHTIGGDAIFENSEVQNLGNLQTIGGTADFRNSQVQSLGNLQTIGGWAWFGKSKVQDLGNLQTIGGYADFENSQVQDLGNLQTIGGIADFRNSQIQSLGNLQTIGGNANFENSQVQDLGNLQTIGGFAYFENSQIQSLGNLQTIGGDAEFENRTDLQAEWESREKKMKMGGKLSPSKTPAPIKERVYGSKINKPKSSASLRSASAIKLSSENILTLNKKVLEFKSKYINRSKKMTLNAVKAVMRRGMGAYSSTHRPTISGGKPNSRVAWGLARVNAFLFKAENGRPKNPKYVQDDDLLRELGYKFAMQMGGVVYLPELYDFDESELKKGGEISPEKFDMPNKEILEYGDFLKKNYPKAWKAGGNIFGNQAFENLKRVSKRGYWLESERWMYDKWQSFVKRHQHNHLLAGVVANVKWASWGNIGKAEAKSVIENAFSKN